MLASGLAIALGVATDTPSAAAAPAGDEPTLTREQARALRSDVAYDEAAIREGRKHYLRLCQNCHGKDGRALESFDFEATDLTRPDAYRHGATDGDLFFSIKEGAGNDMPGFKDKLDDRQTWEVVWFLRSIGPESARPKAGPGGETPAATTPAPTAEEKSEAP